MLGRDGHPAFRIESDRGSALKHVLPFNLRGTEKQGQKSHKTTLFHTVAHFRGWKDSGQALSDWENMDFINEIKDLASILDAGSSKNIALN